MLKALFVSLFFFSFLLGGEYPKAFAKLGTPLFENSKKLFAFEDIETLTPEIEKFQTQVKLARENGKKVDTLEDEKELRAYLKRLRKLQKNYDFLLHLIHQEIFNSIQKREYERFIKLTSIDLGGLLENESIQRASLSFYKENKKKKECKFLEEKIDEVELLEATTQEFFNEVAHSHYDPSEKKKSPKESLFIYTTRVKDEINVYFSNTNSYDVTVSVNARYSNIKESPKTKRTFSVKAKSSHLFSTLALRGEKSSYSFSYSWIIGDMGALHDDTYLYRFPYEKGSAYRISQGYDGKTTHKGSSRFAIDFAMPEGTKVYAAREGVVVKTKSDSNSGGFDRKFSKDGNYITIAHSDGTFATYYHLRHRGVVVKVGQKVEKGAHIGYSGSTGYASGPHLHFAVFAAISPQATQTVAVKFLSESGSVKTPLQGKSYLAK